MVGPGTVGLEVSTVAFGSAPLSESKKRIESPSSTWFKALCRDVP